LRITSALVAVIVEGWETNLSHQPEDVADAIPFAAIEWTEPGSPPGRGIVKVHSSEEIDGVLDTSLCRHIGANDRELLVKPAVPHLTSPPIEDTGDSKVTREPNLCNILNGGVEDFEGAIRIDVSEEARWLDGVVSGTR